MGDYHIWTSEMNINNVTIDKWEKSWKLCHKWYNIWNDIMFIEDQFRLKYIL